jgi:hypothetical protein
LTAVITIVNRGARTVQFELGACALDLHAYRSATRTGPPVFRSEHRQPPGPHAVYACPLILYDLQLAPGESISPSSLRIPLYEILGDSLPEGRYFFTAELELTDDRVRPIGQEIVRLDAGEAVLEREHLRLPAERVLRGIRYQIPPAPLTDEGDSLRIRMVVQNVSDRLLGINASRTCPFLIWAYRRRSERDRAPLREPAWVNPQVCSREEATTFEPGESRIFHAGFSRAVLRQALGPGRYYLSAMVPAGQGAHLAAGEVQIH